MRRKRGLGAALLGLLVLGATAVFGRLRRYAIAESSMAPALAAGDWTLARKVRDVPRRGAIVVFPHPDRPGVELVKRVVGLPGENVVIANGQVHIDGEVLAEPWADGPTRPDGEWSLGAHQVFVLGDARAISAGDSRGLGPIDLRRGAWQIRARYWPLHTMRLV